MSWNYRLIDITDENLGDYLLELNEVFYDDNGLPLGYCPISPVTESVEIMRETLAWFALALDKPILTKADFLGSLDIKDIDNG